MKFEVNAKCAYYTAKYEREDKLDTHYKIYLSDYNNSNGGTGGFYGRFTNL